MSETRTEKVCVKLSKTEISTLKAAAARNGLDLIAYAQKILAKEVLVIDTMESVIKELRESQVDGIKGRFT